METAEGQLAKRALRRSVLQARRSLAGEQVAEKSRQIFARLQELEEFAAAKTLMCYVALEDEVQTREILALALSTGKKVAVPFIRDRAGRMEAAWLEDLGELVPGEFGILTVAGEPRFLGPEEIDVILVPGAAFDRQGNRLGLGGGFYDRFLALSSAFRLGVAFSCQIVDFVPHQAHDLTVDALLTEDGLQRMLPQS